jgi:hypothetical protein
LPKRYARAISVRNAAEAAVRFNGPCSTSTF